MIRSVVSPLPTVARNATVHSFTSSVVRKSRTTQATQEAPHESDLGHTASNNGVSGVSATQTITRQFNGVTQYSQMDADLKTTKNYLRIMKA